ncbi:hypothetical protein CBW24_01000 [Pacificitalea manganoxidans]|uniref:Porin n=1 Tax=Pacificitalea manganoxidans TaxID=1411902 RepID=A0A291LW66_9RHOB|nr:hypothetical protein [Pacificitalea manganoxidans]ATI40728.1 hypothetical protein CBW24_01000 [Pacificitalea manganoxidans]MBF52052.1 hypothetical protein [Actibacterium sp.]MDR6309725.1 hypothetical protein [Pacificitalea manganoxidans]|tara:strand:- start:1059 stop:1835 length:777 start_codon:yes stop_codon:yes gene_type:complete
MSAPIRFSVRPVPAVLALMLSIAPLAPAAQAQDTSQVGISYGTIDLPNERQNSISLDALTTHGYGRFGLRFDGSADFRDGDGDGVGYGAGAFGFGEITPDLIAGPYAQLSRQPGGGTLWSLGVAMEYAPMIGFGAAGFFGESRGNAISDDDGHITNRGVDLTYTLSTGAAALFYAHKDTVNTNSGDADFYDYGIGLDVPFGHSDDPILSMRYGTLREDTTDTDSRRIELGLTIPLGGGQQGRMLDSDRGVLQSTGLNF